jgi:uncharacterized protein
MIRRTIILAITAAASCLQACSDHTTAPERPRYLGIAAEGRAIGTPDTLRFTLVVRRIADTPEAAFKAISTGIATVADKLIKAGLGATDIQITNSIVRANKVCTSAPSGCEARGVVASQNLTVLVRDGPKAGELMALGVAAGAEGLTISEPFFANPERLRAEARANAVSNAQRQADQYAARLGVTLGPVLAVTDDPLLLPGLHRELAPPQESGAFDMGGSVPTVPVEPGLRLTSKTIFVTWEILGHAAAATKPRS